MINIPKGTKDVLPAESYRWQHVESAAREIAARYNLREIRTPAFEHTELFLRGVGETTDIVGKEMYTFEDKGGRSMTLKPEGTAGVVRSFIENGLHSGALPLKTFYFTPVFRYEQPQAGRLREHHQFGIEVFGSPLPACDAEIISAADAFFKSLGVNNLYVNINSIGCPECRPSYNAALREYYQSREGELCKTCKGRLERNPLRILDCKEPSCSALEPDAPRTIDYLCNDCGAHFEELKKILTALGADFRVNPRIVRGLDYYTRTVFEFVSEHLGAKSTVCGGGRYDGLVESLGGKPTPAAGFGLGLERLLLMLDSMGISAGTPPETGVYLACADDAGRALALVLAAELRRAGISAETDLANRSLKAQMKFASKLPARYAVVLGETEAASGAARLKDMESGAEREVPLQSLAEELLSK